MPFFVCFIAMHRYEFCIDVGLLEMEVSRYPVLLCYCPVTSHEVSHTAIDSSHVCHKALLKTATESSHCVVCLFTSHLRSHSHLDIISLAHPERALFMCMGGVPQSSIVRFLNESFF